MRYVMVLSAFCLLGFGIVGARGAETEPWNDPFWTLLHEPAAIAELNLSPAQGKSFHAMRDDLDLRFLPLRNQSREAAVAGATKITAEAREKLQNLLEPEQLQRYSELVLQRLGQRSAAAQRGRRSAGLLKRAEGEDRDDQQRNQRCRRGSPQSSVHDGGKDRQLARKSTTTFWLTSRKNSSAS